MNRYRITAFLSGGRTRVLKVRATCLDAAREAALEFAVEVGATEAVAVPL